MSNSEDEKTCQICADFEPQAWRKSLCRNCFHSLDEHSDDLLAAEAKAVAKEKETQEKTINIPPSCQEETEKGKCSLQSHGKIAENGKGVSWSKDSSKLAKTSLSKSKSITASPSISSYQTLKSSTKSSSSASTTKSTMLTTSTTTSTKSPKVATPPLSTNDSSSKSAQFSKAKNLTSKFENKASGTTLGRSIKKQDSVKSPPSKLETKVKMSDNDSKDSNKQQILEQNKGTHEDKKEASKSSSDVKDKMPPTASKNGEKNSKDLSTRSKSFPIGKDVLKITKDSPKKETKANECMSDKSKANCIHSDSSKPLTQNEKDKTMRCVKALDDKNKKIQNKNTGRLCDNLATVVQESVQRSEHTVSTGITKLSSTGNNTVPSESSNKTEKSSTNSGNLNIICNASETSVKPITTQGKVTGATQKFQNDSGVVEKTNSLSCESNKATEKDEHSVYKDRGKANGGRDEEKRVSVLDTSHAISDSSSLSVVCAQREDTGSQDTSSIHSLSSSTVIASDKQSSSVYSTTLRESPSSLPPISSNKKATDSNIKDGSESQHLQERESSLQYGNSSSDTRENATCDKNGVASATPFSIDTETLTRSLVEKDEKLQALEQQVSKMESEMKELEDEKQKLQQEQSSERQTQKDDMERLLQDLRSQLDSMGTQCERLQTDNQKMLNKLHVQEDSIKRDQQAKGKNLENVQLEEDLEVTEKELEEVKDENKDLQSQIMEMKNEMDEMYDHFRENEHEEFREIQKELDMTAKNCRILQFKLRKSERRNEQIEEDRLHYEEKLRSLESQFDSQDAKNHIRVLEEELRVAKEVSVRLHDELDIVEDRRNKALEENRHLTELLEHTDKRQFRLEMEIDKLRDVVGDLKTQLREAKGGNNRNKESSPDRKVQSYIYTRSILD